MEKKEKPLSVGGQAVIDGVMMKSRNKVSMSVRLPNGEIENENWDWDKSGKFYNKVIILRGFFNFIDMLTLGYKCLMKSAEKTEVFEDENKKTDTKFMNVFMSISTIFGFMISIFLFMWLPSLCGKFLGNLFSMSSIMKSLIEGTVKILIFLAYISLTSLMKDMKVLYGYHGAEHKSIACYEAGEELNLENVRKHTRFHPRCGTSFILISLIVSILLFSVISWDVILVRVFVKILFMPIVIGISYELIKLTAKSKNSFMKIFVWPGLLLQRITTKEPTDEQIEVAIDSLKNIVDLEE